MLPEPLGNRTTYLHLYARTQGSWHAMPALKASFDALPVQRQEALRAQARAVRQVARGQASRLEEALQAVAVSDPVEGPWGLATRSQEPFPLRSSAVAQALEGTNVSEMATKWCQRHKSRAKPLEGFPATVILPEKVLWPVHQRSLYASKARRQLWGAQGCSCQTLVPLSARLSFCIYNDEGPVELVAL